MCRRISGPDLARHLLELQGLQKRLSPAEAGVAALELSALRRWIGQRRSGPWWQQLDERGGEGGGSDEGCWSPAVARGEWNLIVGQVAEGLRAGAGAAPVSLQPGGCGL